MESISLEKRNEIINAIECLLDEGYDEIDVDELIKAYKASKKQGVVD